MKQHNLIKKTASLILAALLSFGVIGAGTAVESKATTIDQAAIDALLADYFNNAAFIGDSVMVGFQNYSEKYDTAATKGSTFLAAKSFAVYYAVKNKKNPPYQGQSLAVWDSVSKMNVKRVFLYLGANDLVGITPEATANNMMELAANIRAVNPDVEIHIMSMSPTYAGTSKGYLGNKYVDEYNALLKEYSAANGYGYVDINSMLKGSDGNLKSEFSSDKYVHLTYPAYEVWNSALKEYALNCLITTAASVTYPVSQ